MSLKGLIKGICLVEKSDFSTYMIQLIKPDHALVILEYSYE